MLCLLPETEIDALCTFYGGLDATRREIRAEGAFNASKILGHVYHDLRVAEEVVRKVWPIRKVQFRGEQQAVSLADRLNEQATAIATTLGL